MTLFLRRLLAAAALLCPLVLNAQERIQIRPLADPKPAVVSMLGAHELTAIDVQHWLDSKVPAALKAADSAGAVVVVVKDGQLLLAKGYGYANVAGQQPVDPARTLFRAGSLSKLFTWTAVMQLVEQGKLDLDADVNRYLDFRIPPWQGRPITLRELMTHTAGFEEVHKDRYQSADEPMISQADWVKATLPARIYPPGEVIAYSNYGGALAGYIVQRVAGQPFETYVQQRILDPLGMRYASFAQPLPAALAPFMARSYQHASQPPKAFELIPAVAAGGLSVSGEAMATFMTALLDQGRYAQAQILRPGTLQAMQSYERQGIAGLLPAGLGFERKDRNGQIVLGQGGSTRWFHSRMLLYPQQRVGLFVAVSGASDAMLRHTLSTGFADRYFPALPARAPPTLATAREHGALLVGAYLNSRHVQSNFGALLNLFNQPRITMDQTGNLVTLGFGEPARHWREVKLMLWLDDASGDYLGARVEHGVLRWVSYGERAPIVQFMPVPARYDREANVMLLAALGAVLLIFVLAWPLAALSRYRRRQTPPMARRWFHASRIAAIVPLLAAGAWWLALTAVDWNIMQADLLIRLAQLLTVMGMLGVLAAAANLICAWRFPGGWWNGLTSPFLLLALLGGLWFVGNFHLLTLRLHY
jgi:CubicO group peptidase (beta-lactamase class C family)